MLRNAPLDEKFHAGSGAAKATTNEHDRKQHEFLKDKICYRRGAPRRVSRAVTLQIG
jgi:hypothetical protein